MWGRKNKKKKAEAEQNAINNAPNYTDKDIKQKIEEYSKSLEIGKASIKNEMKAYEIAAGNLKIAGRKIKKVKNAFSQKISKHTLRKHGDKINAYNESLDAYLRIASHINWLTNTVSSCYDAIATLNEDMKKYDAARKVRTEAQKYLADINYKKAKLEKMTDGIMMPVAAYVK